MKYLSTYKNLMEFNRKDRKLLYDTGIVNHFTISFEFELECNDKELNVSVVSDSYPILAFNKLREELEKEGIDYYLKFLERLINRLDMASINSSYDSMEEICISGGEKYILSRLYDILVDLEGDYEVDNDNEVEGIEYAVSKVSEYLPNFYNRYSDDLKFEFDTTLKRGIEFSPKKYFIGLRRGLEMLDDFYSDFGNQDYWYMNNRTSIHVNIGLDFGVRKWNYIKALIMMGEGGKRDLPYVYNNIEWRKKGAYCRTILDNIGKLGELDFSSDWVSSAEDMIDKEVNKLVGKLGVKTFGINISRIKNDGYVEFRFVGGKVTKRILVDKVLYFCYLVYLMVSDYKEFDYHKKLYKFVTE